MLHRTDDTFLLHGWFNLLLMMAAWIGEWGEFEPGGCAPAAASTSSQAKPAHMRHADEPGLFPLHSFGQVIISSFRVLTRILSADAAAPIAKHILVGNKSDDMVQGERFFCLRGDWIRREPYRSS